MISTNLPDPGTQPHGNETTRVRYVEDLAGPEDAWVSITDAARITRTSEAMARRWVNSGRLPVKRQPVGLNQQTRLVRLSDVAAIRPIIDPTAAISDEIHKLDLPSIPRQQAQIQQDHERLVHQVQEGQSVANELRTTLQELAAKQQQDVEAFGHRLSALQDELQGGLKRSQLQQEVLEEQIHDQAQHAAQSFSELAEYKLQQQQNLGQLQVIIKEQLEEVRAETERKFDQLSQDVSEQREQLHSDFTSLLQEQEARVQHMLLRLAEMQQELMTHQEAMTTLVEQRVSEVKTSLEAQSVDQRREVSALYERLGLLEQQLQGVISQNQAVQRTWQVHQKQVETQEQQLQALTTMLQEEQNARQSLIAQFTLQQELLQAVCRELASLKVGQARTE